MCEVDVRHTLIELLRGRLPEFVNRTAYTFLVDGETEELSLTYGELDTRARAIAARLQQLGAYGERVLLLYPPDLEYIAAFFGCVYAGAVAVPIFAPRANRSLSRLQTISADAEAKVLLTTSAVLSRIEPFLAQVSELQPMHSLATDNIDAETAEEWKRPYIDGDTLAFIQYTSGSTAAPKGVMISHANVLHNERMIQSAFRQTGQSVILSWLPLYHDMGLIGGVLQPLYVGARCILMSPVSFLQKPLRWLQAISRYRATTSGGPNFAYDMCVQKIDPARRMELDLSSWSVAFNGSEPVRAKTLKQFAKSFEPCGFRPEAFFPCYGLAEATLFVSGNPIVRPPVIKTFAAESLARHRVEQKSGDAEADVQELVSSGTTFSEETLIVNPETSTPCAHNEVGEIWIAGDSVAKGYWGHPEETQKTFCARLAGVSGETFLRTGDLGFLHDGELFITGRLKDLIIIRGRNLYPQDIEQTVVECHADLRRGGSVAFSVEVEGEERLVVVQELERHASSDLDGLIQRVRQAINQEHEIQPVAIALVRAGSVPKTSSGKLQRRASREMFLAGSFETLAEWRDDATQSSETLLAVSAFEPENEEDIKEFLKSLFASRLGTVAAEVDVDEPVVHYTPDSLQAIELMHAVEVSLGVVLPMASFLQSPSITVLARQAMQYLAAKRLSEKEAPANAVVTTILPNTLTTHSPSYGQKALWLISRLAPESAAYNVSSAVRIRSAVDPVAMKHALQKLIERHSSLRTTFNEIDGTPVAVVCEEVEVSFDFEDVSSAGEALLTKRLVQLALRPFDLEAGPLFRVNLFKRSNEQYVLLWVAHHIVVDFWSLVILIHEFGELYEAEQKGRAASLASISETYSGYVNWQTELLDGPEGLRLKSYWQKQLGGTLPVLNLPTNHPRPAVQTYRGSSYDFDIDLELAQKLKTLGKNHDATLYMTLLAAFQVLLYRYTGQEDILVGSPAAARSRAAFSNVVGYFVNPLVLRADLSGNATFTQFLRSVRRTVLDAFAHQDYPFALLVQELQPERDVSRSPLFQVTFVLQQAQLLKEQGLAAFALGQAGAPLGLGELVLETMALEQRVAQFDLSLVMAEIGGRLQASLEYNTDIFDQTTIAQMARQFRVLLKGLVANPWQSISSLPLLSDEDRRQFAEWNDTGRDYPRQCIHELFEQQAALTPEHVAVVFNDDLVSYRELNSRANQLAHYLRNLGVGPETVVGICMERSLEMIVALLGVLKAGAAYLPLDPDYPQERLLFMVADAAVPVLLTATHLRERLALEAPAIICLDTEWGIIAKQSHENPVSDVAGDSLAYVIYTSGSTGKPKGAMNTHAAIYNRLCWMQETYGLTPADDILQKTPFSFDVSVWEFFWPLMTGARLVVARPGGHRDSAYLIELIKRQHVTTLHFVPAMLHVFLAEEGVEACTSLRRVICSGEALSLDLQDRFFGLLPRVELHNLYGPTEAAVDVTFWECDAACNHTTVPIGRPIGNTQIYIVDKHNQLVPVGVPGELYIGGVQLARGYHKRAELTAERFVPDPFSSIPGARLYRTGDLARYLLDGSIEYLGRLDFQVKIRGFRIELGEIEAVLGEHPNVRDVVAVVREDTAHDTTGDKRIVAYVVLNGECATPAAELRRLVKEKLPSFMIPAAFVFLSELPLMPNGKIDRGALPAPEQQTDDDGYVEPRNPVEELIAEVWADVLNVERVGIHDKFFELGGHSLLAAQVMSRVQKLFKTELPLRLLFEFPTVAAFAEQMAAIRNDDVVNLPPLEPVSREVDPPLSFAQQRLWFLDQLEPGSQYNMPGAVGLSGPLDWVALEKSLSEIVRRHEILRTTFPLTSGEAVQVVAAPAPLAVPVTDLSELPLRERDARLDAMLAREAGELFDLTRGPLLRVKLVRNAGDEHVLLVTMHHIVSDGWSSDLFLRELATLYQAYAEGMESPMPPLPVQYADFACWQRTWLQDENLNSLLDYWVKQLKGAPPFLELPSDHVRPATRSNNGSRQSVMLPDSLTGDLKRLSREESVTLFMMLAAAFKVLLYRYSGQTDIVIGTVSANRNRTDVEGLIGFFVNTLVLRTELSETRTFRALLGKIRETVIDACTHQDLPFERLVEELQSERDVSRTPIFQVMLVQQKQLTPELESAGVCFRPVEVDTATTKFDLTLNFEDGDQELRLTLEYSTDLFEAATVRRMLRHLQTLLEGAVANPDAQISELPLLSAADRYELLVEFNDTARDSVPALSLHQLFETHAAQTPEADAVVFGEEKLSYAQLNQRANRLARYLRELGVGPEVLVGICLERGGDMVVAVLATLKAGGAYVPLDPGYPRERLKFMLADSLPAVLLTTQSMEKTLPSNNARAVRLDIDAHLFGEFAGENVVSGVSADNPAYVIYTSGSTGQPKGVVVTHRGLGNLHDEQVFAFGHGPRDRVLQFASLSFDASVFEIVMALATGATLVMATNEELLPGAPLQKLLREQSISNLTIPPSALALMPTDDLPELRTVIVAGEACSAELVELWSDGREFFNAYGPTETTIWASINRCRPEQGRPSIGKPIGNTQMFVLDGKLEPVPAGVTGELYIAGVGLARGYLSRPELTATRFVPHPFATTPGARLYRTGDLGRYHPSGSIEFLGRMDHQVKIRGYRVELGEIESALGEHPIVREVVVMVREDTPQDTTNDKRIVAYVVLNDECATPADELRRGIKEKLPSYMIPSAFVVLEAMPLTPNGKIDRKALPEPDQTRPDIEGAFVAPRTPIEEMIADIWSQVLKLEKVGIHDKFFSLGGHSLLATQVAQHVRETFNVSLPLRLFFETPTVADLADYVVRSQVLEADDATLSAALAELSQLSPEEMESLTGQRMSREIRPTSKNQERHLERVRTTSR
jgi:amino acid adenylation domain-containing protein